MKFECKTLKFSNNAERSVIFLLILYLFYYVYRYVFKYNSSLTSSTYSDTPIWLQSLKFFILFFLISYIFSFSKIKIGYSGKIRLTRFFFLLFILQILLFGIYTTSFNLICFSIILIPCFLLWSCRITYFSLERVLSFFWYFSVLYELIQVILYLVYGRLPALAHPYKGWLNVRFGGPLDDPNSFAIILSFYFFYHLLKYKGLSRFLFTLVSSMMLALTLSLTGIFSIIGTFFFVCCIRYYDRSLINSCFMCLIIFMLIFAIILIPNLEYFEKLIIDFLLVKQKSINGHFDSWDLNKIPLCSYFGMCPNDVGGEIGFLRLLSIGGIPSVIFFTYLFVKSVSNLTRKIKYSNFSQYPFFCGLYRISCFFFYCKF